MAAGYGMDRLTEASWQVLDARAEKLGSDRLPAGPNCPLTARTVLQFLLSPREPTSLVKDIAAGHGQEILKVLDVGQDQWSNPDGSFSEDRAVELGIQVPDMPGQSMTFSRQIITGKTMLHLRAGSPVIGFTVNQTPRFLTCLSMDEDGGYPEGAWI